MIRFESERRWGATDKDILEQLYIRHYSAAYLYCLSMTGDPHRAQDIVADAFVKAYLSLPGQVPSFQYWLLRVCRNLWIDQCRRDARLAGEEPLQFAADPHTPESRYLQDEEKRELWNALNSLPPQDRELIILHYFADLPLTQIAPLLGITYPAARKRLSRLRQALKLRLEEHGYGK